MKWLDIFDFIDGTKLASFILNTQDPDDGDDGGIANRPDDMHMADIFHTFFGAYLACLLVGVLVQ